MRPSFGLVMYIYEIDTENVVFFLIFKGGTNGFFIRCAKVRLDLDLCCSLLAVKPISTVLINAEIC